MKKCAFPHQFPTRWAENDKKANFKSSLQQSDLCSAIFTFESYLPSQPVRSPRRDLRVWRNLRHVRRLREAGRVSGRGHAQFWSRIGASRAPVSAWQISISVREPRETGSITRRDRFASRDTRSPAPPAAARAPQAAMQSYRRAPGRTRVASFDHLVG